MKTGHMRITVKQDPVGKSRTKCRKKFLHYFPKGFADKKY
jgi:hypothetical protein